MSDKEINIIIKLKYLELTLLKIIEIYAK